MLFVGIEDLSERHFMDGLLNLNPSSPQPTEHTYPETTDLSVKEEEPPRLKKQIAKGQNITVQVRKCIGTSRVISP